MAEHVCSASDCDITIEGDQTALFRKDAKTEWLQKQVPFQHSVDADRITFVCERMLEVCTQDRAVR